jgi:hypothetical protein
VLLCVVLAQSAWADFAAGERAYDKGDYAAALNEWRPLAEPGNDITQDSLGGMYSKGQGVAQDYAEAHKLIDLAASHASGDNQKKCAEVQDAVAKKMTSQLIAEAQRRAREWKPKSGENKSGRAMK